MENATESSLLETLAQLEIPGNISNWFRSNGVHSEAPFMLPLN